MMIRDDDIPIIAVTTDMEIPTAIKWILWSMLAGNGLAVDEYAHFLHIYSVLSTPNSSGVAMWLLL